MERRQQLRVPSNKPVSVTVFTLPEVRLEATVKDVSALGMAIEAPQGVAPGSAVKIEAGDDLFLGEVVHCRALEHGGWFLGLRFTQVLSGLSALSGMVREFEAAMQPLPRVPR